MYLALLPVLFVVADALPFITFSAFKDCPNAPVVSNLKMEQIAGSWRLAYLFYDEQDDIEEDGTCIVTEFTPIANNHISIAVHMDFRADDFVVDRSSFDLFASFHTPGEWLLHSNSSHTAYLHVKVISYTNHHMILTFCITNATDIDSYTHEDSFGYNYILQKLRGDDTSKYLPKRRNKFDQEGDVNDEINDLFRRRNFFRRKRNLMDTLSAVENSDAFPSESHHVLGGQNKAEKHFWTLVLVKDNDVSAFNFVENASVLMKLGFDIRKGNLIGFGKCDV